MSIRAKFIVESITETAYSRTVKMRAVMAGDGKGNESWSQATPSGELTMVVTNPAAYSQFEVGKPYFLDFTPAT